MAGAYQRLIAGQTIDRAEIVVGLVGALGTNLDEVEEKLTAALYIVGYRTDRVRVSELIEEQYEGAGRPTLTPDTKIDELMDQGDALRLAVGHGAAAAALTLIQISRLRREAGCEEGEREGQATIIRQLKHPEEVRLLRSVYGPRFVLVGAWSPREEREGSVSERLRRSEPGKTAGWYADQTTRLLERDEKDGAKHRLGQRVRDTFQLSDAFVALLPGRDIAPQVERLVRLLFGAPYETPSLEEQAMFQASGARMRSADAGRQVGAVVVDEHGELLVTGTNEVPKAGGGQYWTGDVPDHRDFRLGHDVNERQKVAIVTDLLRLLQETPGWLAPARETADVFELTKEALDGPLAGSRIADLLEFGRIAHAEMAAICTAARRGNPIRGATMMSTTYPCHECARLIIASGIRRVVYVDPYPKSQVPAMYRHQIVDGPVTSSEQVVVFEPFQGVAPRLFRAVFAMADRTRDDLTGDYGGWQPQDARPRLVADAEAVYPIQNMEDSVMDQFGAAMTEAGWWANDGDEA